MELDLNSGGHLYDLFYQFTFFFMLLFYLYEGRKRKYPWIEWLLLIVIGRLFILAGSKIGTMPDMEGRNLVTAILFGLIGVVIAKKTLKINYPVLDAFAIGLPIGMAIQRLGCLFAGCCYGLESNMPWSVSYYNAEVLHVHSPSLHPVAAYYILAALITAFTVNKLRDRWKRPGNLFLFSLLLIFISRFTIDFWRDPNSESTFMGLIFFGLKSVQWLSLAAVAGLSSLIYFREKNFVPKSYTITENPPLYNGLNLLGTLLILRLMSKWMSPMEIWVILIVLIPAASLIMFQIYRQFVNPYARVSILSLFVLSFFLSSQSMPDQLTRTDVLKFGGNTGKGDFGGSCDTQKTVYSNFLAGYASRWDKGNTSSELGGDFALGTMSSNIGGINYDRMNYAVHPYGKVDWEWVGLYGGCWLGNMNIPHSPDYYNNESRWIVPNVGIRLFNEKFFFLKAQIGPEFPNTYPYSDFLMEIGSGFGLPRGYQFSAGISLANLLDQGYFQFKAQLPFENGTRLQTILSFDPENSEYYYLGLGVSFDLKKNDK